MDNIQWFQSEEGQEWLGSKEHEYWIEGGKRGIIVGISLGMPIGMVVMGLLVQFGLF